MGFTVPQEMVEAALTGASEPVERLLETVWPDAYRLARGILCDRQAAEDAAQEACLVLYRSIPSLRNADAFKAWFYRIVVRESTQLKRRRSRTEPVPEPTMLPDTAAAIDLWRALATLPGTQRTVTVLRYFEGLPTREIAAILQTTDGAVRFHLMMAKRRMRPLLDDSSNIASKEVRTHAI
jgi:RNA polymerase sigma factor (sigma-70 family)